MSSANKFSTLVNSSSSSSNPAEKDAVKSVGPVVIIIDESVTGDTILKKLIF